MKKQLLFAFAVGSAFNVFAQLPVSTAPENRKVLLEEFTGIYCGYCPDGHQKANAVHDADPNNVVLVNIHAGGYANVAVGEPDFKTPEGTAINNMTGTDGTVSVPMGITGYPAGDVNRTVFSGQGMTSGGMAGDRGKWASWASTIKSQPAYCNVALQGTIDVTTRVLTVEAQVYYTANSPQATNYLNIFLLEDSVTGPQHNYGNPYYNLSNYNADGTYNHNHVLRKALTPTFGTAIATTTTGSMFSTTVSYTVPLTYGATGKTNPCSLGNLHLAGFVTETDVNVINANHGSIVMTNFANALDASPNSLNSEKIVCSGNLNPTFKFSNLGSSVITDAVFSYSVNGVAIDNYNWSGSVPPQTISKTIDIPTFNFTPLASGNNTLAIEVKSINNGTDANASNNKTQINNIAKSNISAESLDMEMDFTQDQYGSESTWTVLDEVTGEIIETDGPFSDLSASGTLLHTKSFSINENTCYKLVVTDAFGDGINSGYGAGGYVLKSGDNPIISSNGQYATGETKLFRNYTDVGIASVKMNVSNLSVYPNPASSAANINIELSQNEMLNISVMNSLGQTVYSVKAQEMKAGSNNVTLSTADWASGVYFINVSSTKGSVSKKLLVSNK